MNKNLKLLYKTALEKYRYTDCDGDNNHGVRLNYEKFAELIIERCMDIVNSCDPNPKTIEHEPYKTITDKIAEEFLVN